MTSTYRARKKKTWECFKEELFYEPFALILPGIFIWARCYHLHIAIFFNYGYWTSHYRHDLAKCNVFLLFRGNNVYDDTCMITSSEYNDRYREITRTSRKITRYLTKHKEQLQRRWNRKVPVPVQTLQMTTIQRHKVLENSVEKSDSEGNNVQKHVEPEELDKGTKTDNVQMDTEEHVIGEVTEGVVNNVQKNKT